MIDFNRTDGLLEQSRALHNLLPTAKSKVTSEELGEEMRKRERFKLDLDNMIHELATAKDAIDAYMRIIRIEKGTHSTDLRELDTARWDAIKSEKESSKPRSHQYDV